MGDIHTGGQDATDNKNKINFEYDQSNYVYSVEMHIIFYNQINVKIWLARQC